ncbi:hypothetical protein TWF281_010472 [Arthrobotrys megalospora]
MPPPMADRWEDDYREAPRRERLVPVQPVARGVRGRTARGGRPPPPRAAPPQPYGGYSYGGETTEDSDNSDRQAARRRRRDVYGAGAASNSSESDGPEELGLPTPAIPATISDDKTNNEVVLANLLKPVASRQNQTVPGGPSQAVSQSQDDARPMRSMDSPPPVIPVIPPSGHVSHAPSSYTPYGRPPSSMPPPRINPQYAANPYIVYGSSDEDYAESSARRGARPPRGQSRTSRRLRTEQNAKSRSSQQGSKGSQRDFDTRRDHSRQRSTVTADLAAADKLEAPEAEQTEDNVEGAAKPSNVDSSATDIPNILTPDSGSTVPLVGTYGNISGNLDSDMACPFNPLPSQAEIEMADEVNNLQARIKQLEEQVAELQRPLNPEKQTLYRIFCRGEAETVWLDKPRIRDSRNENQHYESDIPIPDERAYFERNSHIHLVVYQDYSCCENDVFGESDTYTRNSFSIVSKRLSDLITELQTRARIPDWNRGYKVRHRVLGPHHSVFHNLELIRRQISTFNPQQQYLLSLVFDYIEATFGHEFRKATELFDQGRVSKDTLCYLMKPQEAIIEKSEPHRLLAYVVDNWPSVQEDYDLTLTAWSWRFNGLFQKSKQELYIDAEELFADSDTIDINELPYYPIKYAAPDSKRFLEERGMAFWRCRNQRFVSYSGWDSDNNEQFFGVRFMIDTMTYRKMHPESPLAKQSLIDHLGERMKNDDPLEDVRLLVFPPTIYGFHVQEKKWFNLKVDNIVDVVWNKTAFDSLVVDESTKLLIVALVSNKISADAGTDLMSNKGNGLIILLHGAPGTGKTLTAGNVAEYAEKPLYRVTTGDVGTDPIAVEGYLQSVLYLGKRWGCVVLLDEADVFLEERTLSDLTRNALVSVFLRVLEYYDGILILTSNRVGTFDSAFKSRIQLAIHYDNLTHPQRIKIWQSFIRRLEDVASDDIDIDQLSLDKNIKKLAKHDLNGRQIRNNITTARQLALYKKEAMNMSHLETVIEVSQKFETYLRAVKAGANDEELAREEGLR